MELFSYRFGCSVDLVKITKTYTNGQYKRIRNCGMKKKESRII